MNELVAPQVKDRIGIIGASDSGTVCGVNPYGSIVDLWMVCSGRQEPFAGNEATEWGNRLEPVLRGVYTERTGRKVEKCPDTFRHPKHSFIVAHPDGMCDDRLLEIKNTRVTEGWGEPGTDQVPKHFLTQATQQMALTGKKLCDVIVLLEGGRDRIYTVPFKERLADKIFELEAKFFHDYVEADVAPDPKSLWDAKKLWGQSVKSPRIADNVAVEAVRMLAEAKERLKAAKADEEAAILELQKYMRSSDTLEFDGKKLASWKTQERTDFDRKAFKEAQSNLYRQFSKTIEIRVFRLLKAGKELNNGY